MKTLIPVGSGRRLLFASGFAAIVALAVIGLFEMDDQSDAVAVKTVSVLVAKSYVASQSALDASCCFEKRIPEIYAPPRPLSKKDLGGNGACGFARAEKF